MLYKNTSGITKKFHGQEFRPGEVHSVSDHINHPDFIYISEDTSIETEVSSVKNIPQNTNKEAKNNGADNSKRS